MIQFKNQDELNIDVYSDDNFVGEINYHKVKGWSFVDHEVGRYYTNIIDSDLDTLKHEIIEYYKRVLTTADKD